MDRGYVVVDEWFQTSIAGVYAIGDLIHGVRLAHAASAQGSAVAERLAGREPGVDLTVVPRCVYTEPEIACVGLSEEEASARSFRTHTGKFLMGGNGRSLIAQEERGFIKIVASAGTGRILGAQMMCARASDLIGEVTTAIANGLTIFQLLRGMRAHPTYGEGIREALGALEGTAIHISPR